MYTLIGTAKLNDVDPQAWLADVLEPRVPGDHRSVPKGGRSQPPQGGSLGRPSHSNSAKCPYRIS